MTTSSSHKTANSGLLILASILLVLAAILPWSRAISEIHVDNYGIQMDSQTIAESSGLGKLESHYSAHNNLDEANSVGGYQDLAGQDEQQGRAEAKQLIEGSPDPLRIVLIVTVSAAVAAALFAALAVRKATLAVPAFISTLASGIIVIVMSVVNLISHGGLVFLLALDHTSGGRTGSASTNDGTHFTVMGRDLMLHNASNNGFSFTPEVGEGTFLGLAAGLVLLGIAVGIAPRRKHVSK